MTNKKRTPGPCLFCKSTNTTTLPPEWGLYFVFVRVGCSSCRATGPAGAAAISELDDSSLKIDIATADACFKWDTAFKWNAVAVNSDLLAACEMALDHNESVLPSCTYEEMITAIRTAIAKAKGET